MVFKNLCVLVLWTKVTLALEGFNDMILFLFIINIWYQMEYRYHSLANSEKHLLPRIASRSPEWRLWDHPQCTVPHPPSAAYPETAHAQCSVNGSESHKDLVTYFSLKITIYLDTHITYVFTYSKCSVNGSESHKDLVTYFSMKITIY